MKPNVEIKAKVQAFIHKYLDVDSEQEALIADYALSTWMPLPETVKYLQFIGDYGTGKTRAGAVMAAICRSPIKTVGYVSPMSVLIKMDKEAPCTLIVDEANFDFDYEASVLFADILSMGAEKGSSLTKTMPGSGGEVVPINFNVFGYKVLLSLHPFRNDSIQERCITVALSPTARQDIPRVLSYRDFQNDQRNIQQALDAFFSETPAKKTIYSPIEKYIESCFSDGAKEVKFTNVCEFIEQAHRSQVSRKMMAARVRELGYEIRQHGPIGILYVQPKGGA